MPLSSGRGAVAGGLYAGLTRRRVNNVAVLVARTDSAAHECLAESTWRDPSELRTQDAAGVARTEVCGVVRARAVTAMATRSGAAVSNTGREIGM